MRRRDDRFGVSVAVDGDTAVIGAYGNDDAGPESGSAYVFVRNGTTWSEQAKLTASDAATYDRFGDSVAADGDTAVIGAPLDDDAAPESGSAYVFVRNGTTWNEQAKLTASDAATSDVFGESVAVDGDTAAIGSPLDDDAGFDSGSAYVFVRSGTTWNEQAKLTASDAAAYDVFGKSVAVGGDTAVVGARLNDDAGTNSGSAYVYILTLDTDEDGIPDEDDNCPAVWNFDQADYDDDGLGDVCDEDDDNDEVDDVADSCPISDTSQTVEIDDCNSGVDNLVQSDGCTILDDISACASDASNHGKFASCVSKLTNSLKKSGLIAGNQKGAIQSCAAQSNIP